MEYKFSHGGLSVVYTPESLSLSVTNEGVTQPWCWRGNACILKTDGVLVPFVGCTCESHAYQTGVSVGVRATYTGFSANGVRYPYTVETYVCIDVTDGSLKTEMRLAGDDLGEIKEVRYPPRFAFENKVGAGYTVLPRMQGTIFPAGEPFYIEGGEIYERDGYIPVFGQIRGATGDIGCGYAAIYDTPFDAQYGYEGAEVYVRFNSTLGKMDYKRVMRYAFFANGDFNTVAKIYRSYLATRGQLVTLKEKIARNPRVADLIGTPIVHSGIAVHIHPKSHYYDKEHPAENDYHTAFAQRAQELRRLKENGAERVYLHLDGWGCHGYDNRHPDPFPVHEAAGGADGMRELQRTCTELGYLFGIHDQYRDYYHDAPSFSFDNATRQIDGSYPYCDIWYGGPHSYLCATLAPDYVRRNYNTFAELDIRLDGSYLDVFSVVRMDECFNPDHPMTRKQCAESRRECLDVLTDRGIIPSSEEVLGCIVNSQVLCHHAPFFTSSLGSKESHNVGIPIPFLNLVYHDCIVIPWFGMHDRGGWGLAGSDRGYLWALACGDTVYYDINESAENIAYGKTALRLHDKVALCDLVSHTFIDGNERRRRSVFSDGTTVEVDFDADTYKITYPDGETVEGQ